MIGLNLKTSKILSTLEFPPHKMESKKEKSKISILPHDTLIHILTFLDTSFILKSWCVVSKEKQKDIRYVSRVHIKGNYNTFIQFLSKYSLKIEDLNLVTKNCLPSGKIKNPFCLIESNQDRHRKFTPISSFQNANTITKENLSSILKGQKYLKNLNLLGCVYFDDELLKEVIECPLEVLNILNTSVSHDGLKEIFTKTKIKELTFGFQFDKGVMCGYPYVPFLDDIFDYEMSDHFSKSLESLKISWYFWNKSMEKFFGNFKSLKRLSILNFMIDDKILEIIHKNCPDIKYLSIKCFKTPSNFSRFKNLHTIKLNNPLNDTLKSDFKNIRHLHLYELSNNDYSFLSELKHLSKLKIINCDIKNEVFKTYQATFQQLNILVLYLNQKLDEKTLDWKSIIPSNSYDNEKLTDFIKDFQEYRKLIYHHNGYSLEFTFGSSDYW